MGVESFLNPEDTVKPLYLKKIAGTRRVRLF